MKWNSLYHLERKQINMDRVLTTEERIKRAEEIYERRKSQNSRYNTTVVNVNEKRNYKLFKKIIIQMLICFAIYYGFYNITSNQYSFSTDTINKAKEILCYDINFYNLYNSVKGILQKNINQEETNQQKIEEFIPMQEEVVNNILEEATLSATDTNEDIVENIAVIEEQPKSQMDLDAEYIKQSMDLVKPLEGRVSSEFGQREATNEIVSENHLGIDVAAVEGTKIVSAMSGTVTIAKNSSTYRKLYKNRERWNIYYICTL